VEIFPGMSCSELVHGEDGRVRGVVAGVFGLNPDGTPGPNYEPGMELLGKYVFLAEGVRGSLSKQVIERFDLQAGHDVQKYGLGMKEIWEIDPKKHREGKIVHTAGWPLGGNAGGGGFIYHAENNQVFIGFVVHLNYRNPHLYPYMEFQRFKHHPMVAELLEGGKRVAYGARAISEGGWQSIPKVVFPGGALLGCSAGLVNLPRIKGNHNAMLSGKAAAEAAHAAIRAGREGDELTAYEEDLRFGTLKHGKTDAAATEPAARHQKIEYPKPDGVQLKDPELPIRVNLPEYDEPAQRYCPAGVYEVLKEGVESPVFVINFQNCVHCKTCDIKDPRQNINWTTPQGGDGPNYPNM